jgi:hypothetical protein
VTIVRDEKDLLGRVGDDRPGHAHCFRRRRRFIQQRRICQRQGGQVGDHRLKVQQRLQPPLRDLRLVGRVLRVPPGVLQDVPLNHRGGEGVVIPLADERFDNAILLRQLAQFRQHFHFAARLGQIERTIQPDRRRNRFVHQLVQRRQPDRRQHRAHFLLIRTDVPLNERLRRFGGAGDPGRRWLNLGAHAAEF